jgi:poly(3-hydroxybutyrate) depolymerase
MLVAPLSGHHSTLLRGTVQALLPAHDVHITDWHDAKAIPVAEGRFDLDDYIDQIVSYLRVLGPGTHVIAVCQPSVPVLAAASLMAAARDKCRPRSLVLMGGPIDTRVNPTKVNTFATRHPLSWFKNTVVSRVPYGNPGFGRAVYPGFLQLSGFMSMNMDRHLGAHLRMFEHLVHGDGDSAEAHRRFYDEYMSVMDLTAEFYLQTVELVFQKHVLPRGEWVSRGRKIEPAAIRDIALLTIEGELDDISAPGQTLAAQDLCRSIPPSKREHILAQGVGHYGIFNGRRWREAISPRVAAFIARHD